MDAERVASLLEDAKYLYEHGAFGPLNQGEFFKAMDAAIEAEAPLLEGTKKAPPPGPPGPNTDVVKTKGASK